MKLLKNFLGITNFIFVIFIIIIYSLLDILVFKNCLYSLLFLIINLINLLFSIVCVFLFIKNMTNMNISDEEFKFTNVSKYKINKNHNVLYFLSVVALLLNTFMIIKGNSIDFLFIYFVFFLCCFFEYTYIDFLQYNILFKVLGYRLYIGVISNDTNTECILLCKEKNFDILKNEIDNIKFIHFIDNIYISKRKEIKNILNE